MQSRIRSVNPPSPYPETNHRSVFGGTASNGACSQYLCKSARPNSLPKPSARMTISAVRILDSERKSTRLNSSHSQISYAVFCLKKNKEDHCARIVMDSLANRLKSVRRTALTTTHD